MALSHSHLSKKSKWQAHFLQQSKSENIMLVNRESRGSTATLQLFQTPIVLIVVMMGRLVFDGGAQVVMMRWDEVQSWHVHLSSKFV